MNRESRFVMSKRGANLLFGVLVLATSIIFSKNGFGFGMDQKYWWVGWVLAGAACGAQFMLASDWRQINFSILMVAIPGYVYSVHTNILGFYEMRGGIAATPLMAYQDPLNVAGGIFMDFYPEIAIAWALGESKVGDFFGNLVKLYKNPNSLTSETKPNIPPGIPRAYQQPLFKK